MALQYDINKIFAELEQQARKKSKKHKKADYTIMFMDGTLRKHIIDTDKQAKARYDILMKQMLEKNPIDENLKDTGPLKWIGLMNNYKHCVEEIIYSELINC